MYKWHIFADGEHIWLDSEAEIKILWKHAREWVFNWTVITPAGNIEQWLPNGERRQRVFK